MITSGFRQVSFIGGPFLNLPLGFLNSFILLARHLHNCRYLFALQIKRDLAMGDLLCNENTAALLASYIVQSDCGDFSSEDYPDDSYLSTARFVPNQTIEFQKKVMENHMKLMYFFLTFCKVHFVKRLEMRKAALGKAWNLCVKLKAMLIVYKVQYYILLGNFLSFFWNFEYFSGMSPGESDLALLETARRCDYYGVKLHAAKVVLNFQKFRNPWRCTV